MNHILINGKVIYFNITKPCPLIDEGVQIHYGEPDKSLYWWRWPWNYIGNKVSKWIMIRVVPTWVNFIEYTEDDYRELNKIFKRSRIRVENTYYALTKPKNDLSISGIRLISSDFRGEKKLKYPNDLNNIQVSRIFRYIGRK